MLFPPIQVRDAHREEVDQVLEITLAAYHQYAATLGDHWGEYADHIRTTLQSEMPVAIIIAESNGCLIGSVLLAPPHLNIYGELLVPSPYPEVRLLAVAPEVRGKGIARLLVDECIRRARAIHAEKLGLHTSDMMQSAILMYERMGFERAPEFDFFPLSGTHVKGFLLKL